ncbi:unnamed protein product [Euphydryas editha]|uniref:Uncharacterized protein n=1 Tax=Euphydryas editha TaxID=104508 RepID=A0AAU9THJ8_EUPED|nr:unnamed protein product [Euphydryas editha]
MESIRVERVVVTVIRRAASDERLAASEHVAGTGHAGLAQRDTLANPRGSTRRKPRCTGAPRVQRSGGPRRACPAHSAPCTPQYPHMHSEASTPPLTPHSMLALIAN